MVQKKSPKANLENKRVLFIEIGLVFALLIVLAAFEYKTYEKSASFIDTEVKQVIEEEQIPVTLETPPPPPETAQLPVLSDAIEIVDDDITIEDDIIIESEDDATFAVEIRDYISYTPEEVVEEEEIPVAIVEEKPTFLGGDENTFTKWVFDRIVYPEVAKENGVQGRVVLSFIVDADGYVKNVTVLRGVDPSIDKEAVRVVSSSPRWKPGRQRDKNVRVRYNFPLNFQLR
ncbi:MAG TPA: energy transducer TonB [Bacteroidales bacterium]|nr:energy transducer TonB [Bacteroidales bacterium]OQB71506.1 MAG: Gram-negative bacterial tonB protein [Bacteroidetes bacterium ADurb.Bin139]MDD3522680.1 energy transducer TonB [Bacteroidales bacterium]MDD4435716.1 energy transducer TonB [Bacteroidales bacterium]HOG24587.1 energy transducer TonB [Bacteroidales bacterium]